jgi:transcriptional regulator with XRE-family HTH domain
MLNDENIYNDIAKRLKSLRKSLKLNQSDFGKCFGITYQQISNIERGISKPSKTLIKLIEFQYGENFGLNDKTIQSALKSADMQNGFDMSVFNLSDPNHHVNKIIELDESAYLTLVKQIFRSGNPETILAMKTMIHRSAEHLQIHDQLDRTKKELENLKKTIRDYILNNSPTKSDQERRQNWENLKNKFKV